ncbi:putative adhesin [Halorubrum virus HRTV-24]|nr:putative adhesin [Halorubrum virus HRTV-24]UBF21793.1 putative adhesin [Halorubrum virus HSTV-3]
MVSYGSGQLGDVTISSNTTENQPVLEYQNLTVEDGVTLTLPSRCRLLVRDVLTVNGTIKVRQDIPGGGSNNGIPDGGASGGKLELLAKEISGSGVIKANGGSGGTANNWGNHGNGGAGTGYSIPATGASGNGSAGGNRGSEAQKDSGNNNWNGNRSPGSGGSAGSSVYNDSNLKSYLEDYLLSGAYITQSPLDTMLPGSGGEGGGGGRQRVQDDPNQGNWNTYRGEIEVSGGTGGAGGSFVASGGNGGNTHELHTYGSNELTNQADANNNTYAYSDIYGGDAGGGGGSGGFILLVSESVDLNVTFQARGGSGGDGHWSRHSGKNVTDANGNRQNFNNEDARCSGGGGGGGSGGFVVGFADQTPTLDLGGGQPGIPGDEKKTGTSNFNASPGNAGQDGVTFIYNIEELL